MAEYGLKSSLFIKARQPEKLITLVLLFILLTAATAGVTSVLISPDWGLLWRGLFLGLMFGWALAMLRQPLWLSGMIITAVGTIYTLLFTGGLKDKVSDILVELTISFTRFATSPGYPQTDLNSLGQLLRELINATEVIFERVRIWIVALLTGEAIFDPVAAILVWSIMVWLVAAWAGWIVEARRNALLAVLPAITLSLGTLSYGRHESFTLYLMLGSMLLLLAIVQYERRERDWFESDIAYPPRKGRQVGYVAIVLSVMLVILSAIVSSISLPRLREWISVQREPATAQEGGLAKSLGIMAITTATPDLFQEVRRPGLPQQKLIGTGPELSKIIVMTVEIDDFPAIFQGGQTLPFYWRSFTYDKYTGLGWRTSDTSSSEHKADQLLQDEPGKRHITIQQTVRSVGEKLNTIYTAGEPASVDQVSYSAWRSHGDLFGIQTDSVASYQASSLFPVVGEDTLRAAGQRYPDWLRQRYLSLPAEVPNRVRDLAIRLTSSEPTPYDRARAIERYLRTFPYTLDVPYPPLDQDLVDFFLFDLRKGYCDYYASAMVVLARAAGVPARIAIGYAHGTYSLKAKRFLVSEADAHSWVEVYFPNIGWIPFEPTAGRPSLENSRSLEPAVTQNPIPYHDTLPVNGQGSRPEIWLIVLGGLALVGMTGITWIIYDEMRLQRLSQPAVAIEVYSRMRRYATHLGVTSDPGNTPIELAISLTSRLQQLSHHGDAPDQISPTIEQVYHLTDRIMRARYHPIPLLEDGNDAIYDQWRSLRWYLRLAWLKRQYQSIRDRLGKVAMNFVSKKPAEMVQEA